jgi:hypothetical protein
MIANLAFLEIVLCQVKELGALLYKKKRNSLVILPAFRLPSIPSFLSPLSSLLLSSIKSSGPYTSLPSFPDILTWEELHITLFYNRFRR